MRLRRFLPIVLSSVVLLAGCGASDSSASDNSADESSANDSGTSDNSENNSEIELVEGGEEDIQNSLDKINMDRWQYNEDTDVYWQTGIIYCENPADAAYENLGIYVPGAYMSGTENGDGTYTCEINASGSEGGYTAETAPIVIPVDTPGYSAMAAPTGYADNTSVYTDAGFIYVHAGCRGRDAGAPAGVTDLKAAIRYIRYNGEIIPGSTEHIFSFGMSGGGAQSALIGATGDSSLYTPYLEEIGAVSGVSDAVAGSMCWCPITSLDYASEAYEWNLGVTRTDLTDDMQMLSDGMAEQFALYVNELGLTDENGNVLTLSVSDEGIYQAGSYYDYLKSVIEVSLNNFLKDTTFPYTAAGGKGGFGGRGGFGGDMEPGAFGDKEGPDGKDMDFDKRDGEGSDVVFPGFGDFGGPDDIYERDGIDRNETTGGISVSGTYDTMEDYISALNAETTWVIYDSETDLATITSIADFVSALKRASKSLGAFDALDESQGENILFGDGDGEGDHFDAVMAQLLADSDYGTSFAEDIERTDALGISVADRVNMYNPLYYLNDYYDGFKTANVASYWRIRTGINQSDTALTTEVNLALALAQYGVHVDFETVWGQAHVEAERTGDSTDNFITWVNECCQ